MIPETNTGLDDFEIEDQPTNTYKLNIDKNTVSGYTDGQDAMRQAVYKMLFTERYEYLIYSFGYGIELSDLYGGPLSYVCSEIERRIKEALTSDERIIDVSDFEFDTSKRKTVTVTFTVKTVFGDISAEKEVNL